MVTKSGNRLAAPAGGNAEHGRGGRGVVGGRLRAQVVGEGDDRRKWKEVGVVSPTSFQVSPQDKIYPGVLSFDVFLFWIFEFLLDLFCVIYMKGRLRPPLERSIFIGLFVEISSIS